MKLSARRRDNGLRHVRSALLGMMLLSSVNIPHVSAQCPYPGTKQAFPADGNALRSATLSYAGNAATWRSIVTDGMTNEARFGTNIVSGA
jgi:hypothetical protein